MKTSNLPSARAPLTDGGEPPTRPWYNFFRNINTESSAGIQAEIYVISQKLGSPDGTVENIPPITSGGVIVGPASVSSAGALPGAVTLSLVNDSASPGNTQLYGTDASGNKGWYAISPLTTKGDLYTFDTGNNRLAIGADTYVLTADSTQATGMKWAAGGGGGSPLTTKGDMFGFSTVAARIPVGPDGTFLGADSTSPLGVSYLTPPGGGGAGQTISNCLQVNDTKTSGIVGGTSSAGINTRVLNTVVINNIPGASLSSNQITLPAGTYRIEATAPAYKPSRTRISLYNVTDSSVALSGANNYAATSGNGHAFCTLDGYITLAASKVLTLRHYAEFGIASNGLGVDVSDGNPEIYAQLFIWKL